VHEGVMQAMQAASNLIDAQLRRPLRPTNL
jgi:hypothetical protein